MKKKLFGIFTLLLTGFFVLPGPVLADWIQDDSAIQKFYQDGVPQFTNSGQIQYSYTSDSFFPLGLYHVDLGPVPDAQGNPQAQAWNTFHLNSSTSRNTLPELKDAGFNTIMRFISFNYHGNPTYPVDFTPNEYELNLLDSYGLKGFVEVLGPSIWSTNNYNGWNLNTLKNDITRIKVHASVLGYQLYDELSNESSFPAPMDDTKWKTAYDTIKATDPNRPVYANTNGFTCPVSNYNDITSFDRYSKRAASQGPPWDGTMKLDDLASATDTQRNCAPNRPLVAIIQANQNLGAGKLPPTTQEIRAQYYTVLVHGAAGIADFTQHTPYVFVYQNATPYDQAGDPNGLQGISPQVHPDLWAAAAQANHEIDQYKWIFLSKTAKDEYHVSYDSHPGGVASLLKDPGDGNLYLLWVSEYIPDDLSGTTPHQVKFTFPSSPTITKVTGIYSGADIPVSNNSVTFNPTKGTVGFLKIEFAGGSHKFGDFDHNDKVDIFDYNVLAANWSHPYTTTDLNNLLANFGK